MNKATSILGIVVGLSATISVFIIDSIGWIDASFGIAAGVGLIYTKNNSLIGVLKSVNKTK